MTARVTVYGAQAIAEALVLSTPARVHIAQQVVAEAAARAPRVTGSYASKFDVEVSGDKVSAVNNDEAASYITFGTSDTPPHPGFIDAARKQGRYTGWQ